MASKFLNISTDNTLGGVSPSDEVVSSQKAIKEYVDSQGGGGGSVAIDNLSITKNSSNQIQTVGVINQNDTTTALKVWGGDEADLPAIKDANTFYATEEVGVSLLDTLYPIGSIYITTNVACPLSTLIAGSTWVLVGQDRVLQGAGTRGAVGTTLNESLPNITGNSNHTVSGNTATWDTDWRGAMQTSLLSSNNIGTQEVSWSGRKLAGTINFDASHSSSTYQDDAPVQPDAYLVNIFRRTA